jgi:hypothetical protein
MHTTITREHVTSVSIDADSVTARAEYADENFCLDAQSEISLRWGYEVDYKAERESSAKNAVASVIEKLQAIVDARFPADEAAAAGTKFERVPVGEKVEASTAMADLAAEDPSPTPFPLIAVIEGFPENHGDKKLPYLSITILKVDLHSNISYLDTITIDERQAVSLDGSIYKLHCKPFSEACSDLVAQWLRRDASVGKGQTGKIAKVYVDTGWLTEESRRFARILSKSWGFNVTTGKLRDFPTAPGDGREWDERSDIRAGDLPAGWAFPLPIATPDFDMELDRLVGRRLRIRRSVTEGVPGWHIGREFISLQTALKSTLRELDREVMSTIGRQSEGDEEKMWSNCIKPVYQRLFGDMGVSVPERLKFPALEDKIRKLVDGRLSFTRQLRGEPGWMIGGELLTLETALNSSDRSFTSRLHGIIAART